jgi:hypothetical protein
MPKVTIELDLNELQLLSLLRMAREYAHGWHTADLVVRRDAIERRYEADWVADLLRSIRSNVRFHARKDS